MVVLKVKEKSKVVKEVRMNEICQVNVFGNVQISTQAIWRPHFWEDRLFGEMRLGVSYVRAFRPTESFRPIDGQWQPVGKTGKGMLGIPLGVSIGFNSLAETLHVAPYLSYQLHFLPSYNASVPLIPQSLIQMGTRIHLSNP